MSFEEKLNTPIEPRTFPGGTDSRYLRAGGIPALGVTPLRHTKPALHEHNESIAVDKFLQGIDFYVALIPGVANA